MAPDYAELQTATAFSFLRGASHAEELVAMAAALGLAAIGIADRNTLAGVVRAHEAAKQAGLRLLVGSRLALRDGTPDLLCYPTDRAAWGRLSKLLSIGKQRTRKGECALDFADVAAYAAGQVAIVVPPARLDGGFRATLDTIREAFGSRAYLAATRRHQGDDARRLRALSELAADARIPLVATNDVLYHAPERRALQDVMTCIREKTTIARAGLALAPNAERHLKAPAEMARLFRDHPQAVARTMDIVQRCRFSLDELAYEYPDEPIPPGRTPQAHLAALTWAGAAARYPQGIPAQVRATVEKELSLIARLDYARYFLTVHDIVRFARGAGILCQGRGSAANSAVCYCLGITAVDPTEIDLLFERFVSAERREPPDIDVDFEHERREEVIQYIYARYGRARAGIAATVIHYRPKMAAREVGKVMGLSEDATAALAAQSWNAGGDLWPEDRLREIGLDPASPVVRRTVALARELVGFPRHLSQHVGGFVLTRGALDETVPIGPAAMEGRSFIEWDKDDIDALGIMKVDVLALGMLTCIRKAFALLQARGTPIRDLADIPGEDPAVYAMLSRGDSIGVFQVESRAQMNMLPRLRPATFYDLVIEVAIVRPGPIQGDMVHPYLRRRQGLETADFPSPLPQHGPPDELRRVLGRTLGVPLFQEQAMRIAIEAAKFTPEEANQLRRAMATFRNAGTIHAFRTKMVEGMVARGYTRDFAERCFRQIEGFGTYGFPESHAASFALLVYVSAWLKCHHPAAFACALLNAQPMGFYAPAQIVRDAREHGASVRGVDVNASEWDCTLEAGATLRLGLRQIAGFRADWAAQLARRRGTGFPDFAALARAGLPRAALEALADADALRSLGLDRRAALWQVRGLRDDAALPLFAHLPAAVRPPSLPHMPLAEQVVADYETTGLSLKAHPMRFLRPALAAEGVQSCAEATGRKDGARVCLAGLVLVRQRPGSAAGVVFATIEDETGIANVVIWPAVLEPFRRAVIGSSLLLVAGRIQRSPEGVVHVVAETLEDRSGLLRGLEEAPTPFPITIPTTRADEMPPALPRSRDFR
ncbi:error-prone DNA polymerase [Limobrevibacterium gyesilva]|uniref:Error-prone DNA polymerase n=1 Tax=Limobrevibacterium gyesilva TaxID=2991712 RepID=A0AA41YPX6_9PROT|nr:error-prone DNA polymerase [Limobrevibacterium gyesilva]MCW3476561.1 error-prone DNA polymerase [Limobrevibacterium gyesilva]